MPSFAFVTCAPGLERLAKRELTRTRPTWRLSFSRAGLLTFKTDDEVALDGEAPTVFARVWGRCLGRVADASAIAPLLDAEGLAPGRAHVFATDLDAEAGAEADTEADTGSETDTEADTEADTKSDTKSDTESESGSGSGSARFDAGGRLIPTGVAVPGELVLDIMTAPHQPAWIGLHRHAPGRAASSGGLRPAVVPVDAPSRAYAKIEEAIAWQALPITAGHVALEIGSAPGGAALALVRRGVRVLGVDAAAMDPGVLATRGPSGATVTHLAKKVGALRWEELPPRVDWLLCDVNLAPQVALHELARLMPPLRRTLRGAVITLKLNDLAFVDELPRLLARVRELGFASVACTHLPSNRQEACAVARV